MRRAQDNRKTKNEAYIYIYIYVCKTPPDAGCGTVVEWIPMDMSARKNSSTLGKPSMLSCPLVVLMRPTSTSGFLGCHSSR